MSAKKYKKIRQGLRQIGFHEDHGAGISLYKEAKKRFRKLNCIEKANI